MNFLIISHVQHKVKNKYIYAYAPYVREMNLWLKHVDYVEIVAPKTKVVLTPIDLKYSHHNLLLNLIPEIQFTSFKTIFKSIFCLPIIIISIFKACKRADHIHLRCPGNIGLLGCLVQILFPKKVKTAKYAGNWNPKAKQPLSYKLQKWILNNAFLTRNITVLIYGKWKNQTKNIKPFFTATFNDSEIEEPQKRDYSGALKFVFLGSLVEGKRPLYAIKLVEALYKQGKPVYLELFGNGVLKEELQSYIIENRLEQVIYLKGNQSRECIKEVLKEAHFSILPSKSEGWPKAIAEAMFFGVIPIVTSVSCVPLMLDNGNRGILITTDLTHDLKTINKALSDIKKLELISKKATEWSQLYTLDRLESEIIKLLKQ